MIPGQTPQPRKRLDKSIFIMLILLVLVIIAALGVICYMAGTKHASRYAVDFTIENFTIDEREPKYKMLPKELSNYICDLSAELELDPDLVVAILMRENPEFNPEATHRNDNGTIDVGMFQLNDYYLWTEFKSDYWFDNIELNPFNWKHNTYIALHHLKYLQDKFKVQDDVIMAYNGGKGAVMNGTVKPSTFNYLANVKNNLFLLKGGSNE